MYNLLMSKIKELAVIVIVGIFITGVVSAATTVGTDINTTGQLTVTSTSTFLGNVGIGTTSPFANLGIQGSLGVSDNQLYLASNGSVLVGTTSLDGNFTVFGNSASVFNTLRTNVNSGALALRVVGQSTGTVQKNFGVSIGFSIEDADGTRINNTGQITSIWEDPSSSNRTAGFRFDTMSGGVGIQSMRLSGAGYLGIGTTTPATRLHVSNGANATTTVTIGELGLTTSKGCVNINQANGSPGSFYLSGGVMVVENNYCR